MHCGNGVIRRAIGTIAVITGLLSAVSAQAGTGASPEALSRIEHFVLETSQQAASALKTEAGAREKLKALFRNRFDTELMGRYAMGGYWQKASAAQQREYHTLFVSYVPEGYADQLTAYRDSRITVIRSRVVEDGDSLITTRLVPETGDELVFHWRVRTDRDQSKVIDLIIGGVSYLTMLREQFTAFAAKNGIDGLIDLLRQHKANNTAQAENDIDGITAKMRATDAIGITSKIALKEKIDLLVEDLGRFHGGDGPFEINHLKTRFDALIQHAVALLQPGDPLLAAEIEFLHVPLWGKLSDPRQFAVVAMR